jgi:hypothetical protein
MGMKIYSQLNFKKKEKKWKKMKIKKKRNRKKNFIFRILKTKKKGKIRGKQNKYLGQT